MGSLGLSIHPLFYLFGVYYALTGRVFVFVVCTICAVVHEIGHSFVASNLGYVLKRITLMPFGAVITGDIKDLRPIDEIKVALAGPFINVAIAIFFIALWWVFPETYGYTDVVVTTNLSLALVNLLPIYPLDGGRVLKSILAIWFTQKTVEIICKSIGIAFSVILLALFVFSCFNTVNLSLLFFSAFVIVSVFSKNQNNSYTKIYTSLSPERLKRGMTFKKQGVEKTVTVKKLMQMLSSDEINEIVVFDNGEIIDTLSQKRINEIIEKGDIYQSLNQILAK